MRTPGNDEELAAGFMTSEGFTNSKADFREIDRCPLSSNPENTIRIRFGNKVDQKSIESRRYSRILQLWRLRKTSIEAIGSSFSQVERLESKQSIALRTPRTTAREAWFDRTEAYIRPVCLTKMGS